MHLTAFFPTSYSFRSLPERSCPYRIAILVPKDTPDFVLWRINGNAETLLFPVSYFESQNRQINRIKAGV
jgi:hypothetical protein